jgi:hypothetical protein
MDAATTSPWHPDRRWADPLITLMAALALLAALFTLLARQAQGSRPAEGASLQARLMEPLLEGPRLLGATLPVGGASMDKAQAQLKAPWDRALLSVLAADEGNLALGRTLAQAPQGPEGAAFRTAWQAAYAGGPLPDPATLRDLRHRLGDGYAAALLEARLLDRTGGDGAALRATARRGLLLRLGVLGLAGGLAVLLVFGGMVFGIYLLATRHQSPGQPLPEWGLSGRAAALVLLAWFLTFILVGNVAALAVRPWPALRWVAVPVGYCLHACVGVFLLCRAEGITLRTLWRRMTPGPLGRALLQGFGFLALAVVLVLALSLLLSPFLHAGENPQRELVDLLRGLRGWGPTLAMFLLVAGVAPCFEETLFRGFLLPVLARRMPMAWALVGSALLFGAIHLQPLGLPTLSMLGLVLGLALRRTGHLGTSILVHACWNGSVFILMRVLGG